LIKLDLREYLSSSSAYTLHGAIHPDVIFSLLPKITKIPSSAKCNTPAI